MAKTSYDKSTVYISLKVHSMLVELAFEHKRTLGAQVEYLIEQAARLSDEASKILEDETTAQPAEAAP